jgi:hypothetical protein
MKTKNALSQGVQQGQALVEFFAAMLVMIPLFWALISLGKLLDFDNAGRQAIRYVNWEQTLDKSIATIANNNEIQDRFLRSPLGGLDPLILNQPPVNPLWNLPALKQTGVNHSIVDTTRPIQLQQTDVVALPLTSNVNNLGRFDNNTVIRAVTMEIPLQSLPFSVSNYPAVAGVSVSSPNVMRYREALLSDTFMPDSEQDIGGKLPAHTMGMNEFVNAEEAVARLQFAWYGFNFFGFNLSSYPYAELWGHNELDFIDTLPNSAVLP